MQAARLYYLIITEQAVTAEHHQMIAEIFSNPAIQHKFVKGMRDHPDAEVFRKYRSPGATRGTRYLYFRIELYFIKTTTFMAISLPEYQ